MSYRSGAANPRTGAPSKNWSKNVLGLKCKTIVILVAARGHFHIGAALELPWGAPRQCRNINHDRFLNFKPAEKHFGPREN